MCAEKDPDDTPRPHHFNDNPRIEQKNWTAVRRVVGYRRYDTPAPLRQMQEVYRLFEPSAKLIAKSRENATVRRRYDLPATPL